MDTYTRGAHRGKITKLANLALSFLKSPETQASTNNSEKFDSILEELNSFLARLRATKESLTKSNEAIAITLNPDQYQAENEAISEYEDKIIDLESRLISRINRIEYIRDLPLPSANAPLKTKELGVVKLPRLELRKFSGGTKEWLPFWEQFKTLVHENQALSASDKFSYLQSALCGKAATTIAGFSPTAECYDAAVALLREEHGDEEKLIDKHMQDLMSMCPIVAKTDAPGLRRLYNTVVTNTRSLTALGIPSNSYYVMLKTALLRCLPSDLRVEFYRKNDSTEMIQTNQANESNDVVSSDLPFAVDKSVKRLLLFIKQEIESLERAGVCARESRPHTVAVNIKHKTAASLLIPDNSKKFCIFCANNDHFSGNCEGKLNLDERKELLKRDGRCFKCFRKGHTSRNCVARNIRCRKCNGRHMYALCNPRYSRNQEQVSLKEKEKLSDNPAATNLYSTTTSSKIYLQTACAFALSSSNIHRYCLIRMVIDSGSQRSYIRESLARELNLPVIDKVKIKILPFGSSHNVPVKSCNRVKVCLRSIYNDECITVIAVVVPQICIDTLPVPKPTNVNFTKFALADSFHLGKPVEGISALIGSDYYWKIVSGEFQRITDSLTAVHTKLGWTIQGPETNDYLSKNGVTSAMYSSAFIEGPSLDDVNRMWDLEEIGIKHPTKCLAKTGEEINKYVELQGDRYTASLLWIPDHPPLYSYYEGARQRFNSLIRKLSRNPEKLKEYDVAMQELISGKIAEPANSLTGDKKLSYYMPHRPVYRYDKSTTQLRVVFDASAHSGESSSLNDCLDTGPNLLPDIISTLLNFRFGLIALIADIEKAFLQIMLHAEDRDVHRFFWFSEPIKECTELPPVKEYRMTRVTFGIKCSPFLMCAVIQKHLTKESALAPEVCTLLKKSFYMDDLVTSTNDFEFAKKVFSMTCTMMKRASMNVRKWNTNNANLRRILETSCELPATQKVLGVIWCTTSDELAVDVKPALAFASSVSASVITKRIVLQLMAHIYDPLGILSPFVVKIKLFFQDLWRQNFPWDEHLPPEYMQKWSKCCLELSSLEDVFIPRSFSPFADCGSNQLHIFADASPAAYGAVVYLRAKSESTVIVRFVCAKNRVAPLKKKENGPLSLPKLELTAALIASRLLKYLTENTSLIWKEVYLWTDSQITLCWISGNIRKWNVYVANRVREIRQHSAITNWHYCPGALNPADFLTRGVFGKNCTNSEFWLCGPTWLKQGISNWSEANSIDDKDPLLLSSLIALSETESDRPVEAILEITKFSNYMRLLKVTAYIQRFLRRLKEKCLEPNKFLKNFELQLAESYWIKHFQQRFFKNEIKSLKLNKATPKDSSILTLNPVLDVEGILRVGTRLQCMDNQYENIFPVILPRSCYLAKLIILDAHERTLHGGVNILLCRVREKFWIPRARQLMKTIVQQCRVCRKLFTRPISQPFAPLPKSRLIASRPFQTVGVDFAGPLYVKSSVDESKTDKMYIMLFTCAVVRAIHLELVPNMTVESCLRALRRFAARRGLPKVIISDNARTFKRAAKELQALGDIISAEEFQAYITSRRISWEFIVERAPWWGGFWERLVRSTKNILKLTIGKARIISEELQTVLTEAESVINSRPLTYVGDDPKDLNPLTPSHFLNPSVPIISEVRDTEPNVTSGIRQLWRKRSKLIITFWKRWRLEYVQMLRAFHQEKKPAAGFVKEGDVVILHDPSVPRLLWRLALIEKVFPGRDGKVRSCEIRLANGSHLRRPVQLLYPLEMTEEVFDSAGGPEDVENLL